MILLFSALVIIRCRLLFVNNTHTAHASQFSIYAADCISQLAG